MTQKKNNDKKRKVKKSSIKTEKEIKKVVGLHPSLKYVPAILLLAIFALSLYLRTVMPYDSVFRDGVVAFASDDAVYHMRLVENTLQNFPNRIFFDPYTLYPLGSKIHFGPLWTQLIATVSLITGMGSYNMETVNTIGAFMPSVFGALVVFPVYFIGRSLGNRITGLIAALMIAVLPGPFFSRSTLGFTDHHVAEVLFSVTTLAFFILAIKTGKERNIKFSDVSLKEKSVIFSLFAGVMLGAFQLTWTGAPFFAMIISIFILIQYMLEDMRGRSTDYLAIGTVPMFLVYFIFVIPYVNPDMGFAGFSYSWFHLSIAFFGMLLPVGLSLVSNELKKRGFEPYYYPLTLGGLFAFSMLIMKIILPAMYETIVGAPSLVFSIRVGGAATVAETTSIFERAGYFAASFPVTGFFQSDNSVLLFVVIVLSVLGYRIIRKQRPEDMLFLVWSIVMIIAIYGQNRWAYYFSINVSLMVGLTVSLISEKVILCFDKSEDNTGKVKIVTYNPVSLVIIALVVIFFVYPSFVTTAIGTENRGPDSRWGGGEPSGGGFAEWLETLNWMKINTPDPGIDYFDVYEKSNEGTYSYPDTAYGVMSWWDYGHIITYWGHRIPNANPFQFGIGGGTSHSPGAASFLTAKTEEQANDVLEALSLNGKPGARYVMTNGYMAYQIMQVFGVWNEDFDYHAQITTSSGPQIVPTMKYYENMAAKLHIFDGRDLKNYRMVHESPLNPNTQGGWQETWYKNVFNLLHSGNVPVENSGVVKVFEFVKGAKITGQAPPDTTVTLTNTIDTSAGRKISYRQTTSSDGTYSFTVPYSTLGPVPGQTQFDTQPAGPYTVTAGDITKQADVSEKDVLEGGTVVLDLV